LRLRHLRADHSRDCLRITVGGGHPRGPQYGRPRAQRFRPDHLRDKLLPHWGEAANFGAFAISEAGAGSDPSASRTKAEPRGEAYCLNGEKMWITNGLTGRWFVTLARTAPDAGKKGLSMILVDGESPGFSRDPIHGKMGIRGSETAVISFADVMVPQANRLGAEGEGLAVGLTALNGGRIGIAAQATGIAEACLDEMVHFAHEREQFGTKLAQFQAIQTMISDSAVELAAARELIAFAADRIDHDVRDPAASSKAKLFATEAANRIAIARCSCTGGWGTSTSAGWNSSPATFGSRQSTKAPARFSG
jgi:butyryl-CoA dehydrogenase